MKFLLVRKKIFRIKNCLELHTTKTKKIEWNRGKVKSKSECTGKAEDVNKNKQTNKAWKSSRKVFRKFSHPKIYPRETNDPGEP